MTRMADLKEDFRRSSELADGIPPPGEMTQLADLRE